MVGAGASQAQTVIFDTETPDPTKAIGIDDLVVDGTTYDVDFTARTNPQGTYDNFPGDLDFNDEASAAAAHDAVDSALNGSVATTVGVPFNQGQERYVVGYGSEDTAPNGTLLHLTSDFDVSWQRIDSPNPELMPWLSVIPASKAFALFEETGGPPAPTIDFSADPASIQVGGTSTLSWSVQDATSCTGSLGDGGWPGDKDPVLGSQDVSPMVTSPYLLTCDGAGGQSESQLTVTVPEPGAVLSMVAAFAALGVVGRSRGKRARGRPSQLD